MCSQQRGDGTSACLVGQLLGAERKERPYEQPNNHPAAAKRGGEFRKTMPSRHLLFASPIVKQRMLRSNDTTYEKDGTRLCTGSRTYATSYVNEQRAHVHTALIMATK